MLNEVFTPPTEQAGSKTVSNLKNNTSLMIWVIGIESSLIG